MDSTERQKVLIWNKIRKVRFEAHNREWMTWARDEMKIEDDGMDFDEQDYGQAHDMMGTGMYGDLDDSGQWMNAGARQENIAYDMSLLGQEGEKDAGYY